MVISGEIVYRCERVITNFPNCRQHISLVRMITPCYIVISHSFVSPEHIFWCISSLQRLLCSSVAYCGVVLSMAWIFFFLSLNQDVKREQHNVTILRSAYFFSARSFAQTLGADECGLSNRYRSIELKLTPGGLGGVAVWGRWGDERRRDDKSFFEPFGWWISCIVPLLPYQKKYLSAMINDAINMARSKVCVMSTRAYHFLGLGCSRKLLGS